MSDDAGLDSSPKIRGMWALRSWEFKSPQRRPIKQRHRLEVAPNDAFLGFMRSQTLVHRLDGCVDPLIEPLHNRLKLNKKSGQAGAI